MKVQNIVNILKAEILAEGDLQEEVKTACGSDMMSDVATPYRMFTACGLLYEKGLEGGCDVS